MLLADALAGEKKVVMVLCEKFIPPRLGSFGDFQVERSAPHSTAVRIPQSVEPEGRAIGDASSAITLADQIASYKGALTARQLSKIVSISAITIYKMATRGVLPSVRIGGCVRFCPTTVARWLRARGG